MINILRTFCLIFILSHYSNATVDLMSNINGSNALLAQSVDNDLYIDILKNLLAVDDKWIAEEYKPYVDTVKFGSFFGEDTKDKMILIKYNKLPHVAGTDRTELLVVNEDSSLRIMKTYSADDVSVTILPSDSGPCFILAICTSASTGAMSHSVSISHIEDNTFVEDDIDYLYDYTESDHMDTVNNIPIIKNIIAHATISAMNIRRLAALSSAMISLAKVSFMLYFFSSIPLISFRFMYLPLSGRAPVPV